MELSYALRKALDKTSKEVGMKLWNCVYVRARFWAGSGFFSNHFEDTWFVQPGAAMTLVRSVFQRRALSLRADTRQTRLANPRTGNGG
jgi:hypothetical protein